MTLYLVELQCKQISLTGTSIQWKTNVVKFNFCHALTPNRVKEAKQLSQFSMLMLWQAITIKF